MEKWLETEVNETARARLRALPASDAAIQKMFPTDPRARLEFGTAGLRAEFGPGPLRMNDVTVMQTAKGLMKQLEEEFGKDVLKDRGIVIGYDHRASPQWGLTSKRFAEAAASVFLAVGYSKIYIFEDVCPTPFVPFTVQQTRSVAGFMMTASHNPKDDAGFKVYWANACQLVSPKDDLVSAKILADLAIDRNAIEILNKSRVFELCRATSTGLLSKMAVEYVQRCTLKLCRFPKQNSAFKSRKICYTAMHGVGEPIAIRLLESFGFQTSQIVSVPEQAKPDFEFRTVPFPNPEEKGALDLAIAFATKNQCTVVLANDPDADRLAVAEWDDGNGVYRVFTGDEIAMLFAWWQLEMLHHSPDHDKRKPAMVISAVSSSFVKHMGEKKGCEVHEALTGFKWIGTKAKQLREVENLNVIFSYEEAIGFCVGDVICDKDGISACAVLAEMYAHLCRKAKSTKQAVLQAKLEELRGEFGYFMTCNGYIKTTDSKRYFERMRNSGRYSLLLGKKYRVNRVRDLNKAFYIDSSEEDGKPRLPNSSLMITFYLEPVGPGHSKYQTRVTLRASGTEPKLKYYVETSGPEEMVAARTAKEVEREVVLGDLLRPFSEPQSKL